MKNLIVFFAFLSLPFMVEGQTYTLSPSGEVSGLVEKYKQNNFSKEVWPGWRIQLVASTDRMKMESALGRWRSLYPNYEATWFHSAPYYILRVGAFTDRLEAIQFLQKIKGDFRGAYPAKDKAIPRSEFFMHY